MAEDSMNAEALLARSPMEGPHAVNELRAIAALLDAAGIPDRKVGTAARVAEALGMSAPAPEQTAALCDHPRLVPRYPCATCAELPHYRRGADRKPPVSQEPLAYWADPEWTENGPPDRG